MYLPRAGKQRVSLLLRRRKDAPLSDLPLDLPPKRKRHRVARAARRLPAQPEQGSLFRAPDVQRCGFCGTTVTVLEVAAACPDCGAIVTRREKSDDE